jgi:NAD(P)-dependent dehydrogenase (short-subunit alcohol dehydrogenase family)
MNNYLVIGASSGIGKELAQQLSIKGNVYATYHQHPIKSTSSTLHYYPLDVMEEEIEFTDLPKEIHGIAYCPGSINLLPFKRIKPQQFSQDFELQVNGAIKVIQKVLPHLKAADKSSILLFSTVAVQQGFNFHSQVSTSKGAIEGLTRALAAEFAPHIRVNAIAPSLTDTPLATKLLNTDKKKDANAQRHPLKSIGTPKNIAQLGTFLLTEPSSWITGQIIHADGGISSIKN